MSITTFVILVHMTISVFFPCYNEEKNLTRTVNLAVPVLQKIAKDWEIILINDGSTDQTLSRCQVLVKKYGPRLKIINHPRNRGYGAALKSGFYAARFPWIAFTDADGQFDFAEITNFLKIQRQTLADLVIGYYLHRQVPFYRRWGSLLWQLAVWLLFGLKVRDIDCGFKLINKKVIDSIPPLEAERGPFISSELLIKAKKQGFKIVEIGVHHYPRITGQATGAKLNVILAGLGDLLKLKFKI